MVAGEKMGGGMVMSRRKAERQYLRWQRYWAHYMGEQYVATPGGLRAYNRAAHAWNRRQS